MITLEELAPIIVETIICLSYIILSTQKGDREASAKGFTKAYAKRYPLELAARRPSVTYAEQYP